MDVLKCDGCGLILGVTVRPEKLKVHPSAHCWDFLFVSGAFVLERLKIKMFV